MEMWGNSMEPTSWPNAKDPRDAVRVKSDMPIPSTAWQLVSQVLSIGRIAYIVQSIPIFIDPSSELVQLPAGERRQRTAEAYAKRQNERKRQWKGVTYLW